MSAVSAAKNARGRVRHSSAMRGAALITTPRAPGRCVALVLVRDLRGLGGASGSPTLPVPARTVLKKPQSPPAAGIKAAACKTLASTDSWFPPCRTGWRADFARKVRLLIAFGCPAKRGCPSKRWAAMRGIALLKVVSAAALLLQASAQSLKELLSAPFAGTESSADGVSTPPDAAAAPATPRKKGRCTNQDRECDVDDDCNFKKAWRAAYGIGTCQGGEGRRRRRTKRTPAPVALNAPTPSPTPRPTPRPTVDAAERKAAATRRCAAAAARPS